MNEDFKIQLLHRRKNEKREISFVEFKKEFAKELTSAIIDYAKIEKSRRLWEIRKQTEDFEDDFYFSLRWNFNNFVRSEWFIARIL